MDFNQVLITSIVFATPVLIVWIAVMFQLKREQLKNQLIGKALDLGKEIDPAWLVRPVKQKKGPSTGLLTWGVVLITLGLAAFTSILLLSDLEWASLSAMLLFPGIGMVVVYMLTWKYKAQ